MFKPTNEKRKADPSYGRFRRLCKKHALTYKVADDGYVDVECLDGTRFSIGQGWDQRVSRLEEILETGCDPGSSQGRRPSDEGGIK
jgi:hypothetical protein